jgi:hypothetical protein
MSSCSPPPKGGSAPTGAGRIGLGPWLWRASLHPRQSDENPDNTRITNGLTRPTLSPSMDSKKRKPGGNWWYLLLLVQFVSTLWVPLYNSVEPAWAGIPFFYWYQMLMVFIGAGITAIVYFATE